MQNTKRIEIISSKKAVADFLGIGIDSDKLDWVADAHIYSPRYANDISGALPDEQFFE